MKELAEILAAHPLFYLSLFLFASLLVGAVADIIRAYKNMPRPPLISISVTKKEK